MLEEEHLAAQSQAREPLSYDTGAQYRRSVQPESAPSGRDTMAEFQEQFTRIAECMCLVPRPTGLVADKHYSREENLRVFHLQGEGQDV